MEAFLEELLGDKGKVIPHLQKTIKRERKKLIGRYEQKKPKPRISFIHPLAYIDLGIIESPTAFSVSSFLFTSVCESGPTINQTASSIYSLHYTIILAQ